MKKKFLINILRIKTPYVKALFKKVNSREKLPRMLELRTDEDILTKIIIKILYENIYEYFNIKYSETDYGWKK